MNDRLKFRVWCKNKQEWEKDEILISSKGNMVLNQKGMYIVKNEMPKFHIIEFCTGLKDKNEKPVFENDYVKSGQWIPNTYIVKFIEGKYCLCDIKSGEYITDIDMIYDSTGCQFEVCGNLHENPELLGGK